MKPYLWWKKYLTLLQLTQFVTIFVSTSLGLYGIRTQGCMFPEWMGWVRMPFRTDVEQCADGCLY